MLLAQISDLHIQHGGAHADLIRAESHLRDCVTAINALNPLPDLVVITGDLTERGKPEEYATLAALLGVLRIPYVLIPGNHDSPANLRAAFPDHDYLHGDSPFVQYAIESHPLRILALDTTVPGKSHGRLCQERLDWLAARLAEQPDRPTVILMHHPPFETGIRQMDALGLLEGRDAFADVIRPYTNIERILCGHLHRTMMCRVGSTVASTCPGTAHQIVLDLTDPGVLDFNFEPPGYQLHWQGASGLVTHHAVLGQYPGPYRF